MVSFYYDDFWILFSPDASASESEDDNERVDAAEEETDEDENNFFDTRDFLSSSSFRSSGSDFRTSSFSSDDDELYAFDSEDGLDPSVRTVGSNFPRVKRRKKLPDPVEKEKGVSLWSMIKDNIGKDLTKVCLPVYFNEPLSSLQKCFEDLEYSYLIDRAYEWGKRVSSFWVQKTFPFHFFFVSCLGIFIACNMCSLCTLHSLGFAWFWFIVLAFILEFFHQIMLSVFVFSFCVI